MFSFTLSWMGRLSHCLVSSLHTTKVMPDQTQMHVDATCSLAQSRQQGKAPTFLKNSEELYWQSVIFLIYIYNVSRF